MGQAFFSVLAPSYFTLIFSTFGNALLGYPYTSRGASLFPIPGGESQNSGRCSRFYGDSSLGVGFQLGHSF